MVLFGVIHGTSTLIRFRISLINTIRSIIKLVELKNSTSWFKIARVVPFYRMLL